MDRSRIGVPDARPSQIDAPGIDPNNLVRTTARPRATHGDDLHIPQRLTIHLWKAFKAERRVALRIPEVDPYSLLRTPVQPSYEIVLRPRPNIPANARIAPPWASIATAGARSTVGRTWRRRELITPTGAGSATQICRVRDPE